MKKISESNIHSPRSSKHPTALALLLMAMLGIIAYGATLSCPFVLDDVDSIVDNPVIKDLGTFLSGAGYAYNPRRFVGYLTFALNYHFGGLNVFGYHLVNLVIHLANGLLVYALASLAVKAASSVNDERKTVNEKTASTNHRSPITAYLPLFAALLFVVHPIQTQAVTYIVQRLASLATLFYLGAVVCYARGRHEALDPLGPKGSGLWGKEAKTEEHISRSPLTVLRLPFTWYLLAFVSGLLALKTKEIAFTLPVAIILYEFIFYGFSRKKLLILLIPLFLGAVVGAIGIAGSGKPLGELLSDVTEMSRQTTAISRFDYLITQFAVVATYLRLLVLPLNQNLDYDYPVYSSLVQAKPLMGLLLHICLIGSALWAWRKAMSRKKEDGSSPSNYSLLPAHYSLIAFGILWFYLTLAVESSIIPITDVIFEHRVYLPSFGLFLAISVLLDVTARKMGHVKVMAMCGIVILICIAATIARNRIWQSDVSLWGDTVAKSAEKYRPRINLAIAVLNAGNPDRAVIESRKAIALNPNSAEAHSNLGASHTMLGELREAIAPLDRALELDPEYVTAYTNLGAVHEKLGELDRAEELYREALRRRPDLVVGQFNLASLLQRKGRLDEAEILYRKVLAVQSRHAPTLRNLGALLTARGDLEGAGSALAEALEIDPVSVDVRTLLGDLALARSDAAGAANEYAAAIDLSPENPLLRLHYANLLEKSRRFDEALAAYGKAIQLDPSLAEAHNNMGVIYGGRGMFEQAAEAFRQAAELSPGTAEYRENLAKALSLSAGKGQ